MRCTLIIAFAFGFGCGDSSAPPEPLGPVEDPLDWVDPTIGTGGFGFAYGSAFVGAAAPHGLVKLGPDTSGEFGILAFQHYSGYYSGDDVIESFSHMHLHGAGLTDYGVIGIMPTTAFDIGKTAASDYRARFSKETELARPGRYEVVLEPDDIRVELAATTRAAHHRYSFPAERAGTLVIDLYRALPGGEVTAASLQLDAATQSFSGSLFNEGQMTGNYGGHELFFAARTRTPWVAAQTFDGGVALEFAAGAPVEMQIGLSLVSAAGAIANLDAELPQWDFEVTADATAQAWRDRLSAIMVEGGTRQTRRMFYSALYRSFLMPTIMSDVDGSYVYGGQTSTMTTGRFVSDLSLWDTYRTLHPLYHLIAPDSGSDAARSLVAMRAAGRGYPRWPIATGESGTMLGASADVVLADAAIKLGVIEDFDGEAVFDDLVSIATDPNLSEAERGGRSPADDYIALGFVPSTVGRSVSTHLEYAVDDYALARMAEHFGRDASMTAFDARAVSYRLLFDPATETFRPRDANGSFPSADGYSPLDFGDEFAEANAAQMLWAPLHDASGLVELLGGEQAFVTRLTGFFESAAADLEANPLDEILSNASPRPHYWHGNEPDIHAAYLFALVGRHDLAQTWLRWITDHLYRDTPAGLPGNDDGGTMSSWYVFTAMGVYPIAGSDRYIVGLPLFPKMTVRTADGTLVIEAPNLDSTMAGVASVSLNGQPLPSGEIRHDDLLGGATLSFEAVSVPTAW